MSLAASSEPTPDRLSLRRWWVCVLLLLATILNYMDRMVLNQTALRIKLSLNLDNEEYGWLESAFAIGFAIGAIAVGTIVDRVSVRWIYPLMVLGWSLAGALTGFASTFWALLSCRFLLGLFEAGNWPCGIRTTRTILPPQERSLGNSLLQSGTALGAILTPLILPALLFWADPQEAQRTANMALTGGTYGAGEGGPSLSWQIPFRLIGALGLVWIGLWCFFGPGQLLNRPIAETAEHAAGAGRFRDVVRDRRYWVLLAIVLGINVTWHSYRVWLPLYLQEKRGFSEMQMNHFTAFYYITADVGAWTIGFLTLGLSRWVLNLHASRTLVFAACALMTLVGLAVPFAGDGWPIELVLLVYAFGALGLFPTYFALSQELSGRHQGKVTGSLGTLTYIALAGVFALEGRIINQTKQHELVLGAVGVIPLLVLALMLWVWPPWKKGRYP